MWRRCCCYDTALWPGVLIWLFPCPVLWPEEHANRSTLMGPLVVVSCPSTGQSMGKPLEASHGTGLRSSLDSGTGIGPRAQHGSSLAQAQLPRKNQVMSVQPHVVLNSSQWNSPMSSWTGSWFGASMPRTLYHEQAACQISIGSQAVVIAAAEWAQNYDCR